MELARRQAEAAEESAARLEDLVAAQAEAADQIAAAIEDANVEY